MDAGHVWKPTALGSGGLGGGEAQCTPTPRSPVGGLGKGAHRSVSSVLISEMGVTRPQPYGVFPKMTRNSMSWLKITLLRTVSCGIVCTGKGEAQSDPTP